LQNVPSAKLVRAEQERTAPNVFVRTETYSVPWIHGTITVKVQTFLLSNLVNYYYAVRRGKILIESNTSTNPDLVLERIHYFVELEV